ncbi:autism susceptibility gene 2 protein homolog isoform X3 [Larimichthys crocea]|uniref:autism susceptibility gene 2 protein homolog isoform X3 n=1 Tax=Larimichthys crocea TaxID=215358 RepID=UPI00090144C1|nr:autism susceptibility gene 2 protein homolog isoform X3 [Larimichthys crocea]
MEGPSRSTGFRQSRRSRSQRDRERRRRRVDLAHERATSLSSGSDREACGTNSAVLGPGGRECRPGFGRHRPPRRRKRESVSCEEDIIDGFAIASFISLEALEMDCSLKPSQRTDMLGRRNKGKRGPEENGGGPLSEPEEGAPHSYSSSCLHKSKNKRRRIEGHPLETGYICDTESDTGDKASDNDMDPVFTVSTRKVVEPTPSTMGTTMGKSCPPLPARCGGVSRLMVTPRVSGLERSQEKSLEQHFPEPVSSSTSTAPFPCLPSPVTSVPRVPFGSNGSRHNGSSPLSKPKPFLTLSGRSHPIYSRSSTPVKPPSSASSVAPSSSSMRPPTPSTSVSLPFRGSGSSGPLRPPSRASSGPLFTPSPGLPPPPPLLQGPAHSTAADQEIMRHNLNSHFLNSQEREGRRSVPGAENNAAAAGRSTPGGPSASSSTPGSSGRASQNQQSVAPPLAFQFHQHNHQHQHTHTHHFTPFLHPTATAPPLFDKYPGKMDGLYRHPFFPQYPPPSVPSIQPVIPPTGPFSSLTGAFQPKGTGPDITARLGVVPHHLQPKDPRLTDPFGTSLKISNKPGKWCAMHVYVAWMILSHQKKVKQMQADPHKLDFRSDLLARLPGAGGLGPLGPIGGALPPTHDLTRPPSQSVFPLGPVNPSSAPFISPSTPHSSFLAPTAHLDPYGRSPPFTPLGALGSGAFGGLGSPTLARPQLSCHCQGHAVCRTGCIDLTSSVFGPKDSPANVVGGLPNPNHHDPWNRLHGGPSGFPAGPSWAKGADKRDERDRGKEGERRDIPHIKDEKDRDNMLYGRQPVRMSPVAPSFKPRSSTPVSHVNGHSSAHGGSSGPIEDLTRSLSRDRERERDRDRDGDKRPLPTVSSRGLSLGSSSLVADRDRPRSSSSSALATPPPSNRSAPSPLDLYPRPPVPTTHSLHSEPSHSQRDGSLPSSSAASASVTSLSQAKKSDRTPTPVSKPPLLLPPVKVKEERKEEPEHIPITLPHTAPSHSFDRPNSHPHHHPSSGTPSSSSLSLTPTPGVPLMSHTPNHHNSHQHLSLLDRSRAIEAYLGSTAGAGLVMGPGGERFHGPGQGPPQGPHSFTWDPWREFAAQQQHHQHRRETLALRSDPHLALRSDPHLARLLQHQRILEAERVAAVAAAAAAAAPHHPPTSTSAASTSAVRQEFGLMAHHFDRPHHLGPPGGGLIDEEQRAQILREDFERARYFGMHPHLPAGAHLSSPSHAATAAHLEQLHPGLLSHSLQHGASPASQHHAGLYARIGHLNPHHVPNGILAKTPAGLVGALAVGAPPPLIPSITSRSSTPPRSSRLGGPGDLALYSAHKDGESR